MMWKVIKQLFCSHEYCQRTVVSTRYEADGSRYRVFKSTCKRCGKVKYEEVLL